MQLRRNLSNHDYRSTSATGKQSRCSQVFRLATNRSICLTFILSLCTLSLVFSLFQCSHYTSFNKLYRTDNTISSSEKGSRKHLFSIRNAVVVEKNEKENFLNALNTFNVKQQGRLILKNMEDSKRLFRFSSAAEAKNTADAIKSSSSTRTEAHDTIDTRTPFLADYNTSMSTSSSSKQLPNMSYEKLKEVIEVIGKSGSNVRNTSVKKTNIKQNHRVSSSQTEDYSDAGDSKRTYEDYGDIMGKQSHKDRVEVDPIRQSFLANVSKYLTAVMQRRKHLRYYSMPITLLPKQTKGVIILTNYRSGSTFMGELFNHHPDAFYTFEPLFPFTGGCDQQAPYMAEILHQIMSCDFPDMMDVYSKVKGSLRKNGVDIECLLDNFCFRRKTKGLCDKNMCPYGRSTLCRKCGPINLSLVKNLCRSKKLSVVKVIRMCDINELKKIVEDPSIDVKIIHLVRDPRGIQSSRSKIHKDWDIKSNSKSTCDRLLHNGLSGNANTSDTKWLQGRYLRIRYEDLSLDPLTIAEKIYKFTDLDFAPEMKSWIKSNTHRSSSKIVNPYSTRRDSVSTMEAWRKHLKLPQILDIQSACTDVMKQFGYVNVTSQSQLENFEVKLIR